MKGEKVIGKVFNVSEDKFEVRRTGMHRNKVVDMSKNIYFTEDFGILPESLVWKILFFYKVTLVFLY